MIDNMETIINVKKELITANSESEYEQKKRELLSKLNQEIEVKESKIYVGIFILIKAIIP